MTRGKARSANCRALAKSPAFQNAVEVSWRSFSSLDGCCAPAPPGRARVARQSSIASNRANLNSERMHQHQKQHVKPQTENAGTERLLAPGREVAGASHRLAVDEDIGRT